MRLTPDVALVSGPFGKRPHELSGLADIYESSVKQG